MDDLDEENIESNWVIVNPMDVCEDVLELKESLNENKPKNYDMESDIESDGISIISESSRLHDSEEEILQKNEPFQNEINVAEEERNKENNVTEMGFERRMNWTFVESKLKSTGLSSANQFNLNCLQEPMEELLENKLSFDQTDVDSDCISTISECDVLHDTAADSSLHERFVTKDNCVKEPNELTTKFPFGAKKYSNGVLLGTILLATTSVFLGHYFNALEPIEEDVLIYKKEHTNDLIENAPDNNFKENMDVPTALAYCQQRHKADDIFTEYNVKKCLRKIENRMKRKTDIMSRKEEINKMEKYLKIREQYLLEKENFLVKREYELLKSELKLKHENTRKLRNAKKKILQERSKNTDGILTDSEKQMDIEEKSEINTSKLHKMEDRHKQLKKKDAKTRTKDDGFKNKYKSKKDNKKGVHTRNKTKGKHSKEYNNYIFNRDEKYEKNLKNKYKDVKHRGHIYTENVKKRQNNNFPVSDSQRSKHDKQSEKKIEESTNYIILENNDNQTVNGYWVGKMYKARNDLKNKRHSGDWYFDRASYRKTKRDKAKWYFDWMMDRELLRYKQTIDI